MALDLALGDGVRVATGGLVALVGLLVLARRSTSPRARPLSLFLVTFGIGVGLGNLIFEDPLLDTANQASQAVLALASIAAAVALIQAEAPDERRRVRVAIAWSIAAGVLGSIVGIVNGNALGILDFERALAPRWISGAAYLLFFTSCSVMGTYLFVTAREARGARDAAAARRLAAMAAALGIYPLTFMSSGNPNIGLVVASVLGSIPLFVGVVAWGAASLGPSPTSARAALGLLVGVPLLGTLVGAIPTDLGSIGIVRVVAIGILAYAIFRLEALGESARPTRDRGAALLTSFLVVLLIVAQVAQNFLSAEYGLLMGGVVAGALVIAARPIERALDRRETPRAPAASGAQERSFLAAARKFHQDGVISPAEERELMILAEHLGIPPSRAYTLRDEVERERPR